MRGESEKRVLQERIDEATLECQRVKEQLREMVG